MDASETEVTAEDQQNINLFGRLNNRVHFIEEELRKNKEENDSLEDASNEIVLVDDETLRCAWGEAFLHVSREDLEEELQRRKEQVEGTRAGLEEEMKSVLAKMAELKVILYGKFGNSINLEEE